MEKLEYVAPFMKLVHFEAREMLAASSVPVGLPGLEDGEGF